MPGPLKNSRHETFARLRAHGATLETAYEQAGFAANSRQNASRLAQVPSVAKRIAEIVDERTAAISPTKESIIEHLVDNAKKAKVRGHYAASNKALELLGKELGMFAERAEISVTHREESEFAAAFDRLRNSRLAERQRDTDEPLQ